MHVLVVDAFATEPMAGRSIAVFPTDELTDDQYRTVARELGADAILVAGPDAVRVVGERADVAAAVAAGSLVDEGREPGTLALDGVDDLSASVRADGAVDVDLPPVTHREADTDEREVADALGIDRAALADVGADLPMVRLDAGPGFLAVPVNFLEHLGHAAPDRTALVDLLDGVDVAGLYAFTFDTLTAEPAWHARLFTRTGEVAASGWAAAGCGISLSERGALDADRTSVVAASGHFLDRPSRVTVDVDDNRVTGRSLTVFDGSATVPEAVEDDIVEV